LKASIGEIRNEPGGRSWQAEGGLGTLSEDFACATTEQCDPIQV